MANYLYLHDSYITKFDFVNYAFANLVVAWFYGHNVLLRSVLCKSLIAVLDQKGSLDITHVSYIEVKLDTHGLYVSVKKKYPRWPPKL